MLKLNVIFCTMLIGVEGAKTPAGAAGQVRPRRSFSEATEKHTLFMSVNIFWYKKGNLSSVFRRKIALFLFFLYSFSLRSFSIRLRLTANIAVAP